MKNYISPFKTEERVKKMCKIMEESNRRAVDEALSERNEEIVLKMLGKNIPIEDIVVSLDSVDRVRAIQQKSLVMA